MQHVVCDFKVAAYVHHVQKRLNEETERILHYLDQSTMWVHLFTLCGSAVADSD